MTQTLVDMPIHIVFSTKHRKRIICPEIEPDLFRYMQGIAHNLASRCLAVNGTEDHVHLLVALSKTITLSNFVREVKVSSTKWVKQHGPRSAGTFGWQDGYGGFAVSRRNVPAVVDYIARQKERHARVSFEDEYRTLLRNAELEYDERYLFD
jgi:REP element-mobilizing transposase RayT